LHELVPAANNIALLVNPTDSNVETTLKSLRAAARDLGVQLHVLRASTEREIDDAFAALSQLKAGGVVIGPDVFFNTRSEQLGALASQPRAPTTERGSRLQGTMKCDGPG
jgi:putative ABC transport system substrate-binding protein